MQRKLKLPKHNNIFIIVYASIVILFISCNSKDKMNQEVLYKNEIKLIENIINQEIDEYKSYIKYIDHDKDVDIEINKVCKLAKDATLHNGTTEYIGILNKYNIYPEVDLLDMREDNEYSYIRIIKIYQYTVLHEILNRYKNKFFIMARVRPIVVPDANVVKIGSIFKAKIYLAGITNCSKSIVTVNNTDTLRYASDNYTPEFIFKTNSLGLKKVNCLFHLSQPNKRTVQYPFVIKYEVVK